MAPEVLKVQLAFPRGAEKSSPVGLVHNDDDPAAAVYELMASDLLNLEAFRWRSDVVEGDVVRWDLAVEAVSTYVVRSAGRCLGISPVSSGSR